jgi:IS1 family transposase
VELCEQKQKRCEAHEREEAGDLWEHTAVAADSKLVVSLVVGKRTQEQTLTLGKDAKRRLRPGPLPAIFTDAYGGYESALLAVFGRRYPQPSHGTTGRVSRPVVRWPQGLAYGQVHKISKGGRGVRGDVRAMRGKARLNHVVYLLGYTHSNTRVVERHNGTSRLRNRRQVRKTLTFSKATRYHRWMSWLAVGLYNFCHAHSSVKITHETQVLHRRPAMVANLADHMWSTRQRLLYPVLGG